MMQSPRPTKFTGLRNANDAPVLNRRELLHTPKSVLDQIGHEQDLPTDPIEAAKLEESRRRKIIGGVFAREEALTDPDILYPLGLRVAYRLTKELARHLNIAGHDVALNELDPDFWSKPLVRKQGRQGQLCDEVMDICSKAEGLHQKGLMLSPPQAGNGTRGHLELWHEAMAALVYHLNIPAGSKEDPDYGGLGLFYLVEYGWPQRDALLMYELILIDEVIDEIVVNGQRKAATHLRERHGYRDSDIRGLLKIAKAVIRDSAVSDVEEERALMALKLEHLQQRAKVALDLRTELGVLKQASIVLGITRAEPESDMDAFVRTVKRVSNESLKKLPEGSADG